MIQCQSAAQAKDYHANALSQGDYFINDQEIAGRLYGRIAERLGIAGPVTKEVYNALCENLHPLTSKPLTSRKLDNRTIGYDINFHCPKSVSICHVLSQNSHILDAFRQSVQETMIDIEQDAQVRVRDKGQDHDRESDGLVWAEFVHFTARPTDGSAPDMHLHSHCMTFNVSHDPVSEKLKAVQFQFIKRDMPYYQSRFHLRLAMKLTELGYQIRRTATAFEIENIPQVAIDLFSKRTNAIGQFIKDNNITDTKVKDKVGAKTRAKKQKGLTMAELTEKWRKQIYALGLTEKGTGGKAIRFAKDRIFEPVTAAECVDFALENRFERASVVHDRRLLESAFRYALGKDGPSMNQITAQFNQDKRIIQVKEDNKILCTTKEVLAQERRLVALGIQGKGKMPPLYSSSPAVALEGQQATAALHVLTTSDRISIISGKAGTGKTTMMKETVRLIKDMGASVTIVAPTANASRGVLRDEGFAEAETVAKLLSSPDLQKNLSNGVLLCDEAGLLGVKDALALLELATRHNARVILVGDASQHSAVDRGDALRILTTVANIRPAQIDKIYRQKSRSYKEAVQAISEGNIPAGFAKLESIGAIKDLPPGNPYQVLANDYVAALKKGKTALVICPTHAEGHQVTKEIRSKLRDAKLLKGKEVTVPVLAPLPLTKAEKGDTRHYQAGLVLQFTQNCKGIQRGSRWTVSEIAGKDLQLKDDKGRSVLFPVSKVDDFEIYRQTEIALVKGDMIRVTRNSSDAKDKRLNNGQMLKVAGFDKKGRIITKSLAGKAGYTLGAQFGHIAYGHCITSHASQGQTVDEVFIAQPAASFAAASQKQFYVSVSRAREKVHIYTDDRKGLLDHVSELGNRESALELLGRSSHHPLSSKKMIQPRPTTSVTIAPQQDHTPPKQRMRTNAPAPSL